VDQFHAAFFCGSHSSTIGMISENSQSRSVTTPARAASSGRNYLRKVITQSARVAILLVTFGMTEDARSGPRSYDFNLLLSQPHPFASAAPSAASPGTPAPVERVKEPPPVPAPAPSRRVHNYTISVRFLPWLTRVTGEVSSDTSAGISAAIDFQDDLGFDDFEVNLSGSANLRLGRHDFWIDALVIDMSASDVVERSITFGSLTIEVSRPVKTEVDLALYDFRYGYSFFDLDSDGFRLGPTFGVAYLDFDVTITDKASGKKESIAEKFPIPRVGLHGEIPFGDFLVEADLSGLYISYDDYEGYAIEGNLGVVWRPKRNFGLVGGYRVIAIDIDHRDNNYDVTFHGPYLGVELRY